MTKCLALNVWCEPRETCHLCLWRSSFSLWQPHSSSFHPSIRSPFPLGLFFSHKTHFIGNRNRLLILRNTSSIRVVVANKRGAKRWWVSNPPRNDDDFEVSGISEASKDIRQRKNAEAKCRFCGKIRSRRINRRWTSNPNPRCFIAKRPAKFSGITTPSSKGLSSAIR